MLKADIHALHIKVMRLGRSTPFEQIERFL